VGLVWLRDDDDPLVEEFIGIVRGRTTNSSRGEAGQETPPAPPVKAAKAKQKPVRKPEPARGGRGKPKPGKRRR
jgi:hypothetical protein